MVSSVAATHFLISMHEILAPKLELFNNVGVIGEVAVFAFAILYTLPDVVPIYIVLALLGETFICEIPDTPVRVKLVLLTEPKTSVHLERIPLPPFVYNISFTPSKSPGFTKSPVLFEPDNVLKVEASVDT